MILSSTKNLLAKEEIKPEDRVVNLDYDLNLYK